MSTEICGHDRYDLRIVLNVQSVLDRECPRFVPGNAQQLRAHMAICEPDKLVEIAAELLRERTSREVVIFSPVPGTGGIVAGRTPSRFDYVVYWDRNHGGTIQIKPPCSPDDPDMSKVFTMQQARAFVLKLLDSPSEQDTV